MQTFTIVDPHDQRNPISEVSTANALMYHGTHSMFSPLIEQRGFCVEGFLATYGAALRTMVAACDDLDFKPEGYATAKGFSVHNVVCFTESFRSARGYAINVGGERIGGALQAAKAFLAFARASHRVAQKAAHLDGILKQQGPHLPTEKVLATLRSADIVRKLVDQVETVHSLLNEATKQGHPVVYAIRADRKWVSHFDAVAGEDGHVEPFGGIKLAAVSADQIMARVDYPNGISPDSE